MSVYIVTEGEYSDYHVEAVFSTESAAEAYVKKRDGVDYRTYRVEEYDMDLPDTAVGYYFVHMYPSGLINTVTYSVEDRYNGDDITLPNSVIGEKPYGDHEKYIVGHRDYFFTLQADSKDDAVEKATALLNKIKQYGREVEAVRKAVSPGIKVRYDEIKSDELNKYEEDIAEDGRASDKTVKVTVSRDEINVAELPSNSDNLYVSVKNGSDEPILIYVFTEHDTNLVTLFEEKMYAVDNLYEIPVGVNEVRQIFLHFWASNGVIIGKVSDAFITVVCRNAMSDEIFRTKFTIKVREVQ